MNKNPQVILKNRYQVVPRTLILVFSGNQVLLQKGDPKKKIYPGYYNGLGGHVERGENILTSARRELKEESGLDCKDLILCGTITIDVEDNSGILLFVFTGCDIEGELRHSDEGKIFWIDFDQLLNYDLVEDIAELVNRIRNRNESSPVFHLNYSYDNEGKRITNQGI